MTSEITGQCLCGAVRFTAKLQEGGAVACHCSQCRRWSGHVWAASQATDLALTDDRSLRWFRSGESSERGFCGDCGSALFYRVDGRQDLSIAAGAIDKPTGLSLRGHIFVADKGDYYTIADGLPEYPAGDL